MRLIDGDKLMMSLSDWWFSSFGEDETEESKAIRTVMHQIEDSLKYFEVTQWIPVTERLPEPNDNTYYLVSQKDYDWLVIARYATFGKKNAWDDDEGLVVSEHVTAYMPLPEPYKETPHD